MNSISRNSTKPQDYSTGFTRKGYARNPLSHAFISFDPFIICMLTFKGDFWINRFSPQDRRFIPTVYLRSFCQIAGVIYPNLCWSSNLENINNNHYHLHLILFPDGLNPYRVNSYVETLENLWMRVLEWNDFKDHRGLDKVVPSSDSETRSKIRKNYQHALDVHFQGSTCSFPQRVNLFTGDIVKNTTPYRCREFTGMGKCIIKPYDRLSYGKAGLFYNQKDQDGLSYCDFSPALIKKARLATRLSRRTQ